MGSQNYFKFYNIGFHSYLYTKVSPDILIKAFFIPKMKAAYVTIIQSLM